MKKSNVRKSIAGSLAGMILFGTLAVQAVDVSEYAVLKGRQYAQDSAATPGDQFVYYGLLAYVRLTADDAVTEATTQPPGSIPWPMDSVNPRLWQFDMAFAPTPAELELLFPNGDYVMSMTTVHDGSKTATLGITGDLYPNTPTFLNFAALDAVDAAAAFTLSWSAFTGATANDVIQIQVEDSDGNQKFGASLGGTATSVNIPANTLTADTPCTVTLTFIKVTARNTTAYAGVTGLGGYFKSTEAGLTTTAGGGGTDTTPPQLVTSVPANGAPNVSVNMPVVFVFNEPMAAAESIAWSANLTAASFNYDWSGDGQTLTCYYLGSLPAGAIITWTLNPSSQPLNFKDVAGNALPANTYTGNFTTAGNTSTNCYEGEDDGRGTGGASKQLTYEQTSSAAPTPHPTQAATFLASVTSPTNNPVTGAKIQVPGGPLLTLTNFMGVGRAFLNMELYASQSALDTARPGGNYNLQLTRTSGSPSANISLSGSYPNTPQIINYDAAQAVNPSVDFVLQWNGFTGASSSDTVSVMLVHPTTFWYWSAPDLCVPRPLANTATSITIPAGTLQTGTTYNCSLTYTRFPYSSTNVIADMQLLSMLQKSVDFTITTTGGGGGGGGARFIGYTKLPTGMLELKIQGNAGESFIIESLDNLMGGWNPVGIQTIPVGGIVTFQVPMGIGPGFFRARKL